MSLCSIKSKVDILRLLVTSLTLLLLLFSTNSTAEGIKILTHKLPPFVKTENALSGLAYEVVKEILKQQKVDDNITLLPFPRALKILEQQNGVALFAVAKTKERSHLFKWVGPLVSSSVYVYTQANEQRISGSPAVISTSKLIAVARNNADHTYFKNKGFKNLYVVNNQLQAINMLLLGRVDYAPISELVLPEILSALGANRDELIRTEFKLYESELYIAFSKDVKDSVINKWQQSLDNVKLSGQYQQIYNKYLDESSPAER